MKQVQLVVIFNKIKPRFKQTGFNNLLNQLIKGRQLLYRHSHDHKDQARRH